MLHSTTNDVKPNKYLTTSQRNFGIFVFQNNDWCPMTYYCTDYIGLCLKLSCTGSTLSELFCINAFMVCITHTCRPKNRLNNNGITF